MKAIFDNINSTCSIEGGLPREIVCEWDSEQKVLRVARDRIGVKSLYYAQLPTSVIVSTELKEILPHIAYPQINMLNLAQPIRYNYPIDLRQTWIEQIKRVRAGEKLIIDRKGIRSHIYWKRNYTPTFKGTKQDALAEALRLLRQSVKNCIETSKGPVAVLLSGGIDSSTLALLTKEVQQDVHVISAGYKGNRYTACDEREVAKRLANDNGLIFHEIELDVNDFQAYLNELIPFLDEPCFDVNCMVQYALYKKAAEMGFKTILVGLGGDELFYSYAIRHRETEAIQLRHKFNQLYPIRKHWKEYLSFVAKNFKHLLLPNYPARIDESMLTSWTYDDYKRFVKDAALFDVSLKDIDVHVSLPETLTIQQMYDFYSSTFAVNMCVYMANKLASANAAIARYPFLNYRFVEFIDSLPLDYVYDPKQPKRFQKEMMADLLPDYVLYAKKRGFEPPFEFIRQLTAHYQYKHFDSSYCFFNSMVADMMIEQQFHK